MEIGNKLPSDYVVLDLETTGVDPHTCEILEIGAIKYKGHREVDRFHTMVKPFGKIPPKTTAIHHISINDVENAPSIHEVEPLFAQFVGTMPIVGYNVAFDIRFLQINRGTCYPCSYYDVMRLVSKCYGLSGIRLDELRVMFHLSGQAHSALGDCEATAEMYQICCSEQYFDGISPKDCGDITCVRRHRFENVRISDICPQEDNLDEDHLLYGKNIVFTGTLSMDRKTAMQMAVDVGACVKSSVTRKTDYLVVGAQDKEIVGDDGMSNKEEAAYALNSSGQANIQIIKETEFLSLVESLANSDEDNNEYQPSGVETETYEAIRPTIESAAASVGANATSIKFFPKKDYCSVSYKSSVVLRMKFRKKSSYIEIPISQDDVIKEYLSEFKSKLTNQNKYARVYLFAEDLIERKELISKLVRVTIDRTPKEWDCCSRYMECSNAKRCVHPDKDFALGCGYRKILASGKIYYGENRNV